MPRYIDASAYEGKCLLCEEKARERADYKNAARYSFARESVQAEPTADVAPVVHAQWKRLDYPKRKLDWYRCTNCGRERARSYDDPHSIIELLPFCNCGARMDEEVKEDV